MFNRVSGVRPQYVLVAPVSRVCRAVWLRYTLYWRVGVGDSASLVTHRGVAFRPPVVAAVDEQAAEPGELRHHHDSWEHTIAVSRTTAPHRTTLSIASSSTLSLSTSLTCVHHLNVSISWTLVQFKPPTLYLPKTILYGIPTTILNIQTTYQRPKKNDYKLLARLSN